MGADRRMKRASLARRVDKLEHDFAALVTIMAKRGFLDAIMEAEPVVPERVAPTHEYIDPVKP